MKINILPISSSLHDSIYIEESTKSLISKIQNQLDCHVNIVNIENLYDSDLALILVRSGGSENVFLEYLPQLRGPFFLLTFGTNNSLAASIEILSYLKDHNLEGEIIHGSDDYIIEKISTLLTNKPLIKMGVIGKPSDWLIASKVDYKKALDLYNISLIDIDINLVKKYFDKIEHNSHFLDTKTFLNLNEINKSEKIYDVLSLIKKEYELSALTIRCFDLLTSIHSTSCMALAKLNSEGIIATCEGDIPTMITMYLIKQITGMSSFQANPSRIDIKNHKMVFAHCTLPLDMVESYQLDTHYESKTGVAIKAKLKENETITIFKLSNNLTDYYLSRGKIIKNLNEENLCRSQIEIEIDNPEYFLKRPYGNHHVIVYGDHFHKIENYMKKFVK